MKQKDDIGIASTRYLDSETFRNEDLSMRVLFVLGSGGHTTRGLILSNQIKAEKTYIVPWESEVTKKKVQKNYFSVLSPRFRAKDSILMTIVRTLFLFLHSLLILIIVRPKIVISTGSGLTIPPFLIARFLRMKTIYIESPSRVYQPSIAGKLLIGKVDLWLSSWPELSSRYKGIEYRGMVF
jgi:beta-1,4-N-acetylglucosaminyltransferase